MNNETEGSMESRIKNVLLADDDSDDRELFTQALNLVHPHVTVETVHDGEELMQHLTKKKALPDLIFLDLNMPRKNGRECLAEIHHNEALHSIPVIVYSTSLNPLDIQDTLNKGARYFLRKPNSFEELKSLLYVALQKNFNRQRTNDEDQFVINPPAPIIRDL
jgi:CheY-like chemotaxis protein